MIVMYSKQTGVAPLDIRCDTVEATPSSFQSNKEAITKINKPACVSAHSHNYSKLECIVLFINLEAAHRKLSSS